MLDTYQKLGKKLQITEMTISAFSNEAEDEEGEYIEGEYTDDEYVEDEYVEEAEAEEPEETAEESEAPEEAAEEAEAEEAEADTAEETEPEEVVEETAVEAEEEGETVLIHVTDYEKLDGYVWNGGAVEMGAPGWYHTEMIPIPAGKELTLTIEARLNPIYYDASGNFISVGNYGSSLEQGDLTEVTSVSPENAAYIVLNLSPSTSDYSEVTISYKE